MSVITIQFVNPGTCLPEPDVNSSPVIWGGGGHVLTVQMRGCQPH
uniref:Uncharacterized protein n=1 Tax=Anguilla anguilla TaxID=7936 RepID=A0A0E9RCA5_ANGAN